jgi:GDP-L-fucose synthase
MHTQAMQSHINVGSNHDITIAELATTIANIVGFSGQIQFDITKPDGTERKLMNSTILNGLGWYPKETLVTGLEKTYADFLRNH